MSNEPTTGNQCAAALAEALERVGVVFKDATLKTNQFSHQYRSKESIFDAIRPVLSSLGVFMAINADRIEPGPGDSVILFLRFTFTHGASGHTVEACGVGQGQDRGDKAISKAQTAAIRSFLDNQFMLGLETDQDIYGGDQKAAERHTPEPARPAPEAKPKPFDRDATIAWIVTALTEKAQLKAEEVSAYLDEYWLPSIAKAASLDEAAPEHLLALGKFIAADLAKASASIQSRLESIGYYGEPEGSDPY